MAIKARSILKALFERGDRPKQADFWDWLDTYFHLSENTTDDITEGSKKFITATEKAKIEEIDGKAPATHTHSASDIVDLPEGLDTEGLVSHSLATAINDFLVASGPGAFIKKTVTEVITILGLKSAAFTESNSYATSAHTHTKDQAGLGNVDNTSDANKPVSTAQQTALDGKVSHSLATAANDFLVASGVGTFVKKTLAEVKAILGLGSAAYTASTDYAANSHTHTKDQAGLGNVDNTSDATKNSAIATLTNKTLNGGSVTTDNGGLGQKDLGGTFVVRVKVNETNTNIRTLNVKVNNTDRTIDLGGDLTVSSAATIAGTNTGDETVTTIGNLINGATSKATPVDADNFIISDSAASAIGKLLSWANLKATLKTYFDTLYAVTAKGVTNGDSHDHNGGDGAAITEAALSLSDVTTGNVGASNHGFCPKGNNNTSYFLDGTGAWSRVDDVDVSLNDVTTGDVSNLKHGFCPKTPNDITKFLRGDGAWAVPAGGGDVSGGSASTDGEVALYSGTGGKTIKRSNTLSGIAKLASGVLSTASAGSDYIAPGAGNADASVSAASDAVAGKVELATSAEITTGTDATRAVTPDGLAGSDFGKRVVGVLVNDGTALTTGDGKAYFRVPSVMNGMNLVGAAAHVQGASSSGVPTIQIRNVTDSTDMLSTKITIDQSENDSASAAAAAVIDTTHDDVATGDWIAIDVDVAGTGVTWLYIELIFQLP